MRFVVVTTLVLDPTPLSGSIWGLVRSDVCSSPCRVGSAVAVRERKDPADEQRLVEQAKAGDRDALGVLLTAHGSRLYRTVLLPRLGNEARARDALGATYERVLRSFDQYEWQPCGFFPWLRVVALRIALDMLRSSREELLYSDEDMHGEIEAAEARISGAASSFDGMSGIDDLAEARAQLHDVLARINPRYATAIHLRILEERSREDVAEQMGISPATFDVLLHRSVASLKKTLESRRRKGWDA